MQVLVVNISLVLNICLGAALIGYAGLSLWPFDWEPPRKVDNGATAVPGGGIRFESMGIARSVDPPEWVGAAMRSHHLELSMRLRSFDSDQRGPVRIMTLSLNPSRRNLTIGQEKEDLIFRLRTPRSNLNGKVGSAPVARIPGVFRSSEWIDLEVLIEPGQLQIRVDGRVLVRAELHARPLENWDPGFLLALGNELTMDRPWLGEIGHAIVQVGNTRTDYAAAGVLGLEPKIWFLNRYPKLVPFQDSTRTDMYQNLVMYVPIGFLLALRRRVLGHSGALRAWAHVFAISSSLELLQFLVAPRCPSIDDLIFNTIGGGIGILLAYLATSRSASIAPA